MGLGPQSPVPGSGGASGSWATRGWIQGCGRVDTAWRPTAQAAIHPVGSAQSFCVSTRHHIDVTHTHACGSGHRFCASAWHHTDVTHTQRTTQLLHECLAPHRCHTQDTHTLFTAVHTHIQTHTHGSGHSFCVSAWHHTDTHTIHSSAHSHSGPLRSPGRWAMERHPLQHPRPMLSANPAAEPEPPEDAASG